MTNQDYPLVIAKSHSFTVHVGPGTVLPGFCEGYFGRDSYGDKTVIAAGVRDKQTWIVAHDGERIVFAQGMNAHSIIGWMENAE